MATEIPAEIEFVTNAVRPEPDIARMQALAAEDLDWEHVVRVAMTRHGIGPLLYRNLDESDADRFVPERFRERLRHHTQRTVTRNLSLTNSLLSILDHLDDAGVPALPYKGPVLSEAIYSDFSLRRSRDLDVLVRPGDFSDAETVLLERGFEPKVELTEEQKRRLMKWGRHRTMERNGLLVELHPRLSAIDPPFEVASLIERAGSIDLAGESAPAIGPADNLLVLCVHGTRHRWNQLKWICDVSYLIRNETIDWPTVLEKAKRRNCYRRVLLGCELAESVLDVELPEAVRSGLRRTSSRPIDDTYPDCLLGVGDTTSLRYRLRTRDSTLKRIRYCRDALTTPPIRETNDNPLPELGAGGRLLPPPVRAASSTLVVATRNLASKIRASTK